MLIFKKAILSLLHKLRWKWRKIYKNTKHHLTNRIKTRNRVGFKAIQYTGGTKLCLCCRAPETRIRLNWIKMWGECSNRRWLGIRVKVSKGFNQWKLDHQHSSMTLYLRRWSLKNRGSFYPFCMIQCLSAIKGKSFPLLILILGQAFRLQCIRPQKRILIMSNQNMV